MSFSRSRKKTWEMVLPFLCFFWHFFCCFSAWRQSYRGCWQSQIRCCKTGMRDSARICRVYGGTAAAETFFPAVSTVGLLFGLFTGYAVWRQWRGALTAAMLLSLAVGGSCRRRTDSLAGDFSVRGLACCVDGQPAQQHDQPERLGVCITDRLGSAVLLSRFYSEFCGECGATPDRTDSASLPLRKDSLPKGELSRAGSLYGKKEKDREKTTLELTFDCRRNCIFGDLWGADYDGKSWRQFSSETYTGKQEGMLDWLNREGYAPVFRPPLCGKPGQRADLSGRAGAEKQIHRVVNKGRTGVTYMFPRRQTACRQITGESGLAAFVRRIFRCAFLSVYRSVSGRGGISGDAGLDGGGRQRGFCGLPQQRKCTGRLSMRIIWMWMRRCGIR